MSDEQHPDVLFLGEHIYPPLRIREEEEYELYRVQYPFDEYYHFKEEFKGEWR